MTITHERAAGQADRPVDTLPGADGRPLYTRYCTAPRPAHRVGEPSFLHAMLVATWLGRLIDPLPHHMRAKGRS